MKKVKKRVLRVTRLMSTSRVYNTSMTLSWEEQLLGIAPERFGISY